MACQVCSHTMHKVGVMPEPYTGVPLFWCPRCGTLKGNVVAEEYAMTVANDVPKLVGRVIEFGRLLRDDQMYSGDMLIKEFERLGIRESICPDGMS